MPSTTSLSRTRAHPELWCLVSISALTHFWHLFTPRAVVFDEVYYERFAGSYLTHSFYFDLHPPLGNLIYALFAAILGIPGDQLVNAAPEPMMRLLPAAFGTLVVPLVYLLLCQLGAARRVATFGALLVLLDNGLLVESRLILLDGFLIFFGLCALNLYLAARRRSGRARYAPLAASALFAGFALSVKWTGASALGVIVVAWLIESFVRRASLPLAQLAREGLVLVLVPIAVYVAAFSIHFALLTHSGPGDPRMSPQFQAQLIGNDHYNPAAHMPLWRKLADVHRSIRYGNASLAHATHIGASRWYTWPIMKHPMGLWAPGPPAPDGRRAMIILIGNPVVWWGALLGVLVGLVIFLTRRSRFAGHEFGFLFLFCAVLLNYLPFAAITRLMYIYHYLFALVFVIALGAFSTGVLAGWMDASTPLWHFSSRRSAALYWGVLGLALISFVYFLPFTFGWPLSRPAWDAHFWVLHPSLS
jgi:dolichyl-phosphate-mannose-protein mannosyltransferase